jgi:hypothetical protein
LNPIVLAPLWLLVTWAPSGCVPDPTDTGLVSSSPDRGDTERPGPPDPAPRQPAIRLNADKGRFEVSDLDPSDLRALAGDDTGPVPWAQLFAVYTDSGGAAAPGERPPILGTYRVEGNLLVFQPRFPLERGLKYRAVLNPSRLPSRARRDVAPDHPRPIVAEIALPRSPAAATTTVAQVFPTRDQLPENLLKFYLHFSAPMSRGEAYKRIHLLGPSDKPIDLPFLELGEELWDPTGMRLTLLFDPGRIKKGLKPREELGPVLEAGKSYTLIVERDWPDAQGQPLKSGFRRPFRVGPPDERPPDPHEWTLTPPRKGTRAALMVAFPEPLDHAMLERVVNVEDSRGQALPGTIMVEAGETRWRFVPARDWDEGKYLVRVATALEDLAGNSIGRPFEVDEFQPIQRRVESETISLPFEVRSATSAK